MPASTANTELHTPASTVNTELHAVCLDISGYFRLGKHIKDMNSVWIWVNWGVKGIE